MAFYSLDYKIFYWINHLAGAHPVLDSIGIFLAVYGIFIMAIVVLGLAFSKLYRANALLAMSASFLSRLLVVELLKVWADRPRPFEVLSVHQLLVDLGSGKSFSSGHAVIMFSMALAFWRTKYFWPLFLFALLSSGSRIYVGVHYPLDVFASFPIALGMVWLLNKSVKAIK